ncbi:MAG: hypothetical protein EOP33_06690 [Rickettsiaceae bacterium]|nr:MAG: hypothetical protein EOP33_06690 [Rickettsiaceae bacterium]
MAIKKRTHSSINKNAIESLANELADKPYGQQQDNLVRTTVTLPASTLILLEDMARNNKRRKDDLTSVSAIIRDCVEKYINMKY